MRVLVVDTYYPAFLTDHYGERPSLRDSSYDEQLRSLYERRFGTSDFYSRHLRELGHETAELVVNCEPLQFQWAREHGMRMPQALGAAGRAPGAGRLGEAGLHSVAATQIEAFAPDVLYLQDLWFFKRHELERFREGGALVAGQIASRAPPAKLVEGFDLIVSSFPHFVERFRGLGIDSCYLPIAFEPRVLEDLNAMRVGAEPGSERSHEVAFVGGLDPSVHPARVELLERVAAVAELDVWGYGAEALPPTSPLRGRYRGQAWGLDMYRVLADSKIVVNRHIDAAEGNANNMRLFESTGVGAMLLTDEGANLSELFESGRELITYDSAGDLVESVRHYLGNEDERRAIAAAGQQRTLGEHTYGRRIAELAEALEQRLKGP